MALDSYSVICGTGTYLERKGQLWLEQEKFKMYNYCIYSCIKLNRINGSIKVSIPSY